MSVHWLEYYFLDVTYQLIEIDFLLNNLQESKVHEFDKRDALNFIATLMSEEEAVGDVSTLTSSNTPLFKKRKKQS